MNDPVQMKHCDQKKLYDILKHKINAWENE